MLKHHGRRILSVILYLCMLVIPVNARGSVDTEKTGNIIVSYPVDQVEFRLYRVGELSENGQFSFTEKYASYPLSLDIEEQSEWAALADTVAMYIEKDEIAADESSVVVDGSVSFLNESVGLYLVVWDSHVTDGMKYTAQPFFVSLPNVDEEDNWVYDINAVAKFGVEPYDEEPVSYHVHKVWDDENDQDQKRPESITVELLRNGEVFDTAVLNAENNWSYDWIDLDAAYEWKVNEQTIPDGYTMTVSQEGNTLLITNTRKPEKPDKPNEPELPYTGTTRWLVPVFAMAGLLLLSFGLVIGKKKEEKK